jgi:hypothetical protein
MPFTSTAARTLLVQVGGLAGVAIALGLAAAKGGWWWAIPAAVVVLDIGALALSLPSRPPRSRQPRRPRP